MIVPTYKVYRKSSDRSLSILFGSWCRLGQFHEVNLCSFWCTFLQVWYLPVSHPTNCSKALKGHSTNHHHTTPPPQPFYGPFWDHPGESVPEENFWTLWCREDKQRQTHRPSRGAPLHTDYPVLTSTIPPYFLQAGCPSCRPTNRGKALKETAALTSTRKKSSTGLSLSWTTNWLLRERDTSTPGVAFGGRDSPSILLDISENTSFWQLKRLVTLSTYRRYTNNCIYLHRATIKKKWSTAQS